MRLITFCTRMKMRRMYVFKSRINGAVLLRMSVLSNSVLIRARSSRVSQRTGWQLYRRQQAAEWLLFARQNNITIERVPE